MDIRPFKHAQTDNKTQKDYWDWWLSDDQPPASVREEIRRQRVRQANAYQPRQVAQPQTPLTAAVAEYDQVKSIVINLSLPEPRAMIAKITKPKVLAALVLTVALFIVLGKSGPAVKPISQQAVSSQSQTSLAANGLAQTQPMAATQQTSASVLSKNANQSVLSASTSSSKPNFVPVVPNNKSSLADSPFARSAYNADAGIYTFIDNFMGQPLTVNEKAIPSSYSMPQLALRDLANQIGATQAISFNNNTAYMQPAGASQQSVVVVLRGVLVFLNSPKGHSVTDWTPYLQSLN